jgi:large subunit ribosomal protein L23
MALFDFFKNKPTSKRPEKVEAPKQSKEKQGLDKTVSSEEKISSGLKEMNSLSDRASRALVRPHITEKSTELSQSGAYVFRVDDRSNKSQIKEAVEELYAVKVDRVNLINIPAKKRFSRTRAGKRAGYKKAVVFLGAGQKIELT